MLPWATSASITGKCTKCGDCVSACPEQVIVTGSGGFPTVSFDEAGCSFCGACAEACEAGVFLTELQRPWAVRAAASDACMEHRGIACRLCEDACDQQAIRFHPQPGGRTSVTIDQDACVGCGTCVSRCPASAISVSMPARGDTRAG